MSTRVARVGDAFATSATKGKAKRVRNLREACMVKNSNMKLRGEKFAVLEIDL